MTPKLTEEISDHIILCKVKHWSLRIYSTRILILTNRSTNSHRCHFGYYPHHFVTLHFRSSTIYVNKTRLKYQGEIRNDFCKQCSL